MQTFIAYIEIYTHLKNVFYRLFQGLVLTAFIVAFKHLFYAIMYELYSISVMDSDSKESWIE